MIIDFHSHILPGIDDGAENAAMSEKMMKMEKSSGVDAIVATPHFYMSEQSMESFLEKREKAFEQIKDKADNLDIDIHLGAEVYFTHSLVDIDLKKLCIGNTDYLMIELPYQRLSNNFIRSFKSFAGSVSSEIRLVLAHAERYLKFTDEDSLYEILDTDILVQLNCGSFKSFSPHIKFMCGLIAHGGAHLLGTDCHNITSRAPNMELAKKVIGKKFSNREFLHLMDNAEEILYGN